MTIVAVTGCTNGLGMHCVTSLASRTPNPPSFIILSCRNTRGASAVADKIAASTSYPRAQLIVLPTPLDLSSLASVRAYVAALKEWLAGRTLTSLVNNAGVGGSSQLSTTIDGFESIFQSNHLGHFLLTLLLMPTLNEASRVVNVSSEVHDAAANKIPMPEPSTFWPATGFSEEWESVVARGAVVNYESVSDSGQRRYTRSKLLNVLFTHELARLLSGAIPHASTLPPPPSSTSCTLPGASQIRVLSYNPGLMLDTNFVANLTGSWFIGWVAWFITPILRLTPMGKIITDGKSSGATLGELALPTPSSSAWLDATATSCFFDKTVLKPTNAFTLGERGLIEQKILWEKSLAWARVTKEELKAAGLPHH